MIDKPSTDSILPAPFAWCEIPAGNVQLIPRADENSEDYRIAEPKSGYQATLPNYAMAKYPITNAQFAKFIDAGGYQDSRWWTKTGWSLCQAGTRLDPRGRGPASTGKAWSAPVFWDDTMWNGANYPVVGVSWYEAYAFCRWLSEVTGENIMLPTEFQWQRAAQGDDTYPYEAPWSIHNKTGRTFPWGNEWDASRCNHHVDQQGIGRTTPVQQYEGKGDSYFSVVDMAGNVSEWCFNKSSGPYSRMNTAEGDDDRYIRGGSWLDGDYAVPEEWDWDSRSVLLPFHTDYRNGSVALNANTDVGFRIVCNEA
jgi:formylglycine-generating enzyme required for sulfatase activity